MSNSESRTNFARGLASLAAAAALFVGGSATTASAQAVLEDAQKYFAVLNAGQVVETPVPASNASGVALLTYNGQTGNLCYTVTFSGLVGTQMPAPHGAHIHGPAGPGLEYPIHVAMLDSGSPVNGCTTLTKDQAKYLKASDLYLQIHTDAFPAGEIRGQIVRLR